MHFLNHFHLVIWLWECTIPLWSTFYNLILKVGISFMTKFQFDHVWFDFGVLFSGSLLSDFNLISEKIHWWKFSWKERTISIHGHLLWTNHFFLQCFKWSLTIAAEDSIFWEWSLWFHFYQVLRYMDKISHVIVTWKSIFGKWYNKPRTALKWI